MAVFLDSNPEPQPWTAEERAVLVLLAQGTTAVVPLGSTRPVEEAAEANQQETTADRAASPPPNRQQRRAEGL
ncbi:hypothetical protein [Streptomyces sp. NPDC048611]|uniref:hypothetical protein n=1 Tax=Streptomyces sp. NPDC048611 TaxID=3155635 RepID=UPI003421C48E